MSPSPSDLYTHILRNDFMAFVHRAFLELNPGSGFNPNWHVELMAVKLERAASCLGQRLIVNVPPRHLKSFVASVVLPAWLFGHYPTMQIMTVSYGQDLLSDKLARDCRTLMSSPFYQALFPTRLSPERNTVAEFETTQGGCRLSTSIGGVVTGRGADVIIIDDPLKADDALSDQRRGSVNAWYDTTLRSRLNNQDEGSIIIVMQRLHTDDLVAHVQQAEHWDRVSIPLVAETTEQYQFTTPYGRRIVRREAGEVIDPARLSPVGLERLRRTENAYNFAAQYQQTPEPPSGLIVQRKWLKFYTEQDKPKSFDRIVQSWDTANKVSEISDFSVCTSWGIVGHHMYLLDVFRRRLEFPELKSMLTELANLWNAEVVLVEDKASGTQLIQELRASGFTRVAAASSLDGDKVMRLRAQTAKIEGGFVLFPTQAPWLDEYLRELLSFPNSKYADQVDSTVFALAWNTKNAVVFWTDTATENFQVFAEALAFRNYFGC